MCAITSSDGLYTRDMMSVPNSARPPIGPNNSAQMAAMSGMANMNAQLGNLKQQVEAITEKLSGAGVPGASGGTPSATRNLTMSNVNNTTTTQCIQQTFNINIYGGCPALLVKYIYAHFGRPGRSGN